MALLAKLDEKHNNKWRDAWHCLLRISEHNKTQSAYYEQKKIKNDAQKKREKQLNVDNLSLHELHDNITTHASCHHAKNQA